MNDASSHSDVVIIGLGAAGGIAAQVLTEAGLEVTALEAGEWTTAQDITFDELRNDIRNWMADPKARGEVPTWRTDASADAGPSPWPMLMGNAVGGSSVHYEAVSFRFLPWNFRARSETIERYGEAALPAGSTLADWPVSYEELEPYYERVEQTIGVAGVAGNVPAGCQPGGNPFEGKRNSDYPLPRLRPSGWSELMDGAARRLGWHPFPSPAAINTEEYDGRQTCTYCGFCQSNGCYRNAKGSTNATAVPRALATGRLKVQTGARAIEILVSRDGRASGVRYVRDGQERTITADAVLVAGFTYENTRLLLLSKSDVFPSGLANNNRQVGRNFIAHVTPFAYGVFPGQRLNLFTGTMAQSVSIDDFNGDNFDHAQLGFIGGGVFLSGGEVKPIFLASGSMVPPWLPRWGSEWKAWLREYGNSIGGAYAQFDSLSYEDTYLDLDPVARDSHGVPVVRVTHRLHDNELRAGGYLAGQLEAWLKEAGAERTWSSNSKIIEGRHVYGGTRMGADADTSVVDPYGFAHECPNLGVLGASVFPTAGGYNPTLTVQAVAWRSAKHLADNWSSRTGGTARAGAGA